jgi:glycosyltransferase involved in cell wall biosynthesis
MGLWEKKKFQVLMSYYNAEEYLDRALLSLEHSMEGFDWILVLGGDSFQKGAYSKIERYSRTSSAKKVVHNVYDKAINVSTAKNRLLKESLKYSEEYPGILVMDADDEMTKERPRLIETAAEYDSPYVVGAWSNQTKNDLKLINAKSATARLAFTSCCTLLHVDMIPKGGRFFYDKVTSYGDVITWHYLKKIKKIRPQHHLNWKEPVHIHYKIPNSITNPEKYSELKEKRRIFSSLKKELKNEIDIFNAPPDLTKI